MRTPAIPMLFTVLALVTAAPAAAQRAARSGSGPAARAHTAPGRSVGSAPARYRGPASARGGLLPALPGFARVRGLPPVLPSHRPFVRGGFPVPQAGTYGLSRGAAPPFHTRPGTGLIRSRSVHGAPGARRPRRRAPAIVVFVPAPWYAGSVTGGYAAADGYVPTDAGGGYGDDAVEGGLYEGGAYDAAVEGGGCAVVDVGMAAGEDYSVEVALPTPAARTPAELAASIREAHRRGREVRLRTPGGLGIIIPAGPGVRSLDARYCR